MGGVLLRNALAASEQRWLYESLYSLAEPSSEEVAGLHATAGTVEFDQLNPDNRPQPFVTWVHPYTRASNARERPSRLLAWAQELMHSLVPNSRTHVVNSMLAQLYAGGGSLLRHRDEDLSWGLGVSLGCAAEFDCLPEGQRAQHVLIRTGDIIVGEFGKMPHAVRVPKSEPPGWWHTVHTFGTKRRCNVLFRQALTAKEQRSLAEQRAWAVYGMSLDALQQQTGKDAAFLAVHLRHAAVE